MRTVKQLKILQKHTHYKSSASVVECHANGSHYDTCCWFYEPPVLHVQAVELIMLAGQRYFKLLYLPLAQSSLREHVFLQVNDAGLGLTTICFYVSLHRMKPFLFLGESTAAITFLALIRKNNLKNRSKNRRK